MSLSIDKMFQPQPNSPIELDRFNVDASASSQQIAKIKEKIKLIDDDETVGFTDIATCLTTYLIFFFKKYSKDTKTPR